MTSLLFLAPLFLGASSLYLYAVAWGFREAEQRSFSRSWLLLPVSGALLAGITLVFSIPASPAFPVSLRLLELLAHFCNILLIWAIAGKIAPATRLAGTLLYAWNPLVLLELAVYANTAGVVIFLLLLAVALLLTGSPSLSLTKKSRLCEIAALVLVGLAMRIELMTLLLAPLLLWFMVRHRRGAGPALLGFAWRALLVLAIFALAYLPDWRGSATFLAITNGLRLFDFANSPLGLIVAPARSLFTFVAQRAHFPPLMQPTTAADMTVLSTSFFLFALLYLREMGRVRARIRACSENAAITGDVRPARPRRPVGTRGRVGRMSGPRACPRPITIRTGSDDAQRELSQQDEDEGTGLVFSEETRGDEDKHKAPAHPRIRPLSLQDGGDDAVRSLPYDVLFTSWVVVIVGYIVLAATVFLPGYIVWGVWVVALRRFDTLSVCMLLLSCSALLYYPLQRVALDATGFLLPLCVFGIPLVYLLVQYWMPAGRMERKKVLK